MTPSSSKISRLIGFPVRRPWVVIGIVATIAFGFWVVGTRQQPYHVQAAFASAVDVTSGLDVRVDGVNVGKISSVQYSGGEAIIGIGISDPNVYPLHQGTQAAIRFGTTAGNGTRRIDLTPGPRSAPAIPNGGIIPIKDTVTAVEFDQMFNTFNSATRANMQGLFKNTGNALHGHAPQLNAGLHAAPPAFAGTEGLMGDLASDTSALQGLIVNGDRAASTIAARAPELQDLMSVAAGTFHAFAQRTDKVQQAISGFAPTLSQTRQTLQRLDTSVNVLGNLVTDLAPGAVKLRSLAEVARPAFAELQKVAPLAASTVEVGSAAAPSITRFLASARPFMSQLAPVLNRSTPMLGCIRPYAPELAGFASTWSSFTQNQDSASHYARIHAIFGGTQANGSPLTDQQMMTLAPGLSYAFPRVPGLNSGQPWFIPACGYTPATLNPAADPESHK